MTHESDAAELADAFAHGDDQARSWVARTCEEQGIVAVLVAERLRERGMDKSFVEAMKRSADGNEAEPLHNTESRGRSR
jgi:hypothetical protein